LYYDSSYYKLYGLTVTLNDDKTIVVSGSATSNTKHKIGEIELDPGTYKLLGCPSGGGIFNTYALSINIGNSTGFDIGEGYEFTLDSKTVVTTSFILYKDKGYIADNLIFKPMIVLASETDLSYDPFKIEKYDLREVQGVTNLLPCNAETQTVNGITCTNNDDGTYTLNGTATSAAYIELYDGPTITIKKGDYIGSLAARRMFYIRYNNNSDYKTLASSSLGDSLGFTIEGDYSFNRIYIYIAKGGVVDNEKIMPMLELGNKSHRFVPPGRWIEQTAKSDNKFIKENAEIGYYLNSSGEKVDGASYYTSNFIDLDCDYFSYFGSRVTADWSIKLCFYNE
ncbi:MAG: hypothetical protein K2G03_04020, partial [Bacilli bacterium]|nr:hypothetical protein [Bacilli bacterium]